MTDRKAIEALTRAFRDQTVLVVGDLMLDRYVSGSVSRISPEAPVPVVVVEREDTRLGGAANVALNIRALGGDAVLAGIIGQDEAGKELLGAAAAAGISPAGILEAEGVTTSVKTRVLADRQQVVRVDRENPPAIGAGVREAFTQRVTPLLDESHAAIIEDYGKGTVEQPVVDAVLDRCAAVDALVGLDPKDNHALAFSRLSLATPNYMEACGASGVRMTPLGDDPAEHPGLAEATRHLLEQWNCELLIVTLGAHGMCLASPGEPLQVIPTKAREVFDVSGAGDTFMAAAMLALASGADRRTAAMVANVAAGVVVGKVGTATCSARELLANWI